MEGGREEMRPSMKTEVWTFELQVQCLLSASPRLTGLTYLYASTFSETSTITTSFNTTKSG